MVTVRFSSSKGMAFLPLLGLGLAVTLLALWGPLKELGAHLFWLEAVALSGFLWACGQIFAFLTLEEISLSKAAVFFNLNSLFNIALGVLLFKEASGGRALFFILLGGGVLFAGTWWVSRVQAAPSQKENLKKGILFSLLAAVFWGIYFLPIKAIQIWGGAGSLPALSLVAGLSLGGIVPIFFVGLRGRKTQWCLSNLGWGLATAFLWAAGMCCFLSANRILGLSRAVPIVNSNALLYAGWSLFVFKELPFRQWPKVLAGTALVVAGVSLMAAG
jgi:drug/metabolite transporter (DMT)-like permease